MCIATLGEQANTNKQLNIIFTNVFLIADRTAWGDRQLG